MRTDLTTACLRCRVRLRPTSPCPVCRAEEGLRDLRDPAQREEAFAPSAPPSSKLPKEELGWALQFGFLMLALVLLALAALTFGSALADGELHLAVLLALIALVILFFVILSMRASARVGPLRLIPGPVVRDGAPREEIEGVADGEERLRGPLSGTPCLAYRLVGEGPLGALDDSRGGRFVVATEEGPKVLVLAERGGFELEPEGPPAPVEGALLERDPELLEFLRERGADPSKGPLRIAEALLRAGDRVAVGGSPTHPRGDSGYRLSALEWALEDAFESPLRVRRLEPPRSPEEA